MLVERALEPFVKEAPEPSDVTDGRLVTLLAHWNAQRERAGCGAPVPPVGAIDPSALRFILGWLMIIEPLDDGVDFKYRLYGSAIAATTGRDLTGCKVSDSFPMFAAWTMRVYRATLANRHPVLTRHSPRRLVPIDQWERLILPYAGADGAIGRLLVGAVIVGKRWNVDPTRLPWPLNE
jgi:hypothetical protein